LYHFVDQQSRAEQSRSYSLTVAVAVLLAQKGQQLKPLLYDQFNDQSKTGEEKKQELRQTEPRRENNTSCTSIAVEVRLSFSLFNHMVVLLFLFMISVFLNG